MANITLDKILKKKTVYIFLVRTDSFFSRVIACFTGRKYTHASIGFDSECKSLYSFARLHTHSPLPAGFVKESRDTGLLSLSPNAPCAVFKLNVTAQTYEDIKNELEEMYGNKEKYHYCYAGPFMCYFGIPFRLKDSYFCSQFVVELLHRHRAITLTKPASLYHPSDIENIPGMIPVFRGRLSEISVTENRKPSKSAVL